jgi:peptidyl-prolyl cis-trans isomerase D
MFDLFRSRDKLVRIVLTGLLGLVGLSMVTYLIPGSGTTTTGAPADTTVVATVGKDDLTTQQVSRVVQNMMRNRQLPPDLLAVYVPQIVQQMISDRAMAYEAGRLGFQVTPDETDNAIMDSMPAQFVKDGKVDAATLAAVLQQQGATLADLKEDTTRELLASRLKQIVGQGVLVSQAEIETEFHRKNDKVRIQYALVTPAKYQAEAEPTDAEVKAYYDAHKSTFVTPDKHSLAIVLIDPAKVSASLNPSDAELQKAYNANLDKYRTPERVKLRHILIKSDASNDAQMKAKADGLLKQLQADDLAARKANNFTKLGDDFGKMAMDNSQDPGSAAMGGELGWIVKGQTVPEFEKAAFALQPGVLSNVIKTVYGYHILLVEAHEFARLQPFDEVKGQLTIDYMQRNVNTAMQNLGDKALALMRKDPMHPEKVAEAVGPAASLIHADNLQAGDPIPDIGVSKELSDAVAALRKGEVTAGFVVLTGNKVAVAVCTDYQAAHPATFEEAKTDARNRAAQEKLQTVLVQKARELESKAQSMDGDLEKAAKAMGIEVKTSMDVDQQATIEGAGPASGLPDAFTRPVGALFGPVAASGDQLVGKVVAKIPANMADLSAQTTAIRDQLKQIKTANRAKLFEDGVKKRLQQEGKLKIHQDVITRIVQNFTARG